MVSTKQSKTRRNTRHLILILIVWFVAMVIVYAITAIRINRISDKIRESGIEIAHEFSKHVSLPLLEANAQTIQTLLLDAAKRPEVVYASVVDHRKKVLAFVGAEHFLPDTTEADCSVENVSIRQGGFEDCARILNFASEVTYAGTAIGEIFVGLSATEALRIRSQFISVAVSTGLILLALIVILRFRDIGSMLPKFKNHDRRNPVAASDLKKPRVTCPLCGTQKPLLDKVFNPSNLDRVLIIEPHEAKPLSGKRAGSKGIKLSELANREELSWIRRQVILRCTEIIRRLAV